MPQFIVISGKKSSGKTTTANMMKDYINTVQPDLSVKIVSFATPIKEFCQNVIGLSYEQIYGTDEEKNTNTSIRWESMPAEILSRYKLPHCPHITNTKSGTTIHKIREFLTAREVMQIFGTDIMRTFFGYDIWSKVPFNKDWGSVDVVIIDDCRFPNEADIALQNDAILIRLTRNPLQDIHVSESAMDTYDEKKYTHIIHNSNISLKHLHNTICEVMCYEGFIK